MISSEDIKELISCADAVCDSVCDLPSGCEGCSLFDEEEENWECPLTKIISKITDQMESEQ